MGGDLPDFYYFPSSFYSQKALLALTEKRIPVNKHIVSLASFENYSAWYMKLNPKGQVPILVDEDKVIADSSEIIKYCDDKYGSPVMMPEHGKEKWQYIQKKCEEIKVESITYGASVHQDLAPNSQMPQIIRNKMKATVLSGNRTKTIQKLLEKNPNMAEIYEAKIKDSMALENVMMDRDLLLCEIEKVKELLTEINNTLTESKEVWLCGPEITIADICVAILLQRLKLVGFAHLWESGKLPLLESYYKRLLNWKPFNEVCVQGSSVTTLIKLVFAQHISKITIASGLVLVAAAGIGYWLYRKK